MGFLKILRSLVFGRKCRPLASDSASLSRWEQSETREVTKPRDPRSKFCFANIGRPIQIIYKGQPRTIVPMRLFSKPQFRKSYVQAQCASEILTFDIQYIKLPKGKR